MLIELNSNRHARVPETYKNSIFGDFRCGNGALLVAHPIFCLLAYPCIPLTGLRYNQRMIRSFGDKRTEALFQDKFVRDFQGFARPAKRKLEAVNAAGRLEDLQIPPSNRLEALKGDLKGFYSIRINDQWRLIFTWINGDAHEVCIVDYH